MRKTTRIETLAAALAAALAGTAAADVAVNGVPVSSGGGTDWIYEAPVIRLTGPGPFVVSGSDLSGGTALRADADCEVVASNLVLDATATGVRPHSNGIALVNTIATDGAGTTVIDAGDGLYVSGYPTSAVLPDDPAAAYGSYAFAWGDIWQRSNIAWTPAGTNSAALAWTGERFVAARYRGGFAISEDGATWREAAWDGNPVNLRAVVRGGATGGTLAAASTQGLWLSHDGGLSWSQATNFYSYAVVWSAGRFVAVGVSANVPAVHWSDDEGATWRSRAFPGLGLVGTLGFVVADGGGRFLAGSDDGFLAFHFENGELVLDGVKTHGSSVFAVAAGGGVYVTCFVKNTGLRVSTNGVDWVRADKQDGTFVSIVYRNGAFFAEGIDSSNSYSGLWISPDGANWSRVMDDTPAYGLAPLDCGSHAVTLSLAGDGNLLVGGFLAPAIRVATGGTVDVAAAPDARTAFLNAVGDRYAAAIGGAYDQDAGSFAQRSGTVLAAGGAYASDIGPGYGGAAAGSVTILGGSLHPCGNGIATAPSNGVEAVRCVVVDGLAPGAAVELAKLPDDYGTDGVVADAYGCVYLWLPPAAESFRFIAGGALRRVAAGGASGFVETLPPPAVEDVSFSTVAERGTTAIEVKMRVSSPVEYDALAPAYAADLAALAAGGGSKLVPTKVDEVGVDEYELTFRLPDDDDSGFIVIRAE